MFRMIFPSFSLLSSSSSLPRWTTNVLTISCVCTHRLCLFHRGFNCPILLFGALYVVLIGLRGLSNWFLNHILWKFTFAIIFFCARNSLDLAGKKTSTMELNTYDLTARSLSLCLCFDSPNFILDFSSSQFFFYCFCLSWKLNFVIFVSRVAFRRWTRAAVMENVHKWHYGFINIQSRRSLDVAARTKKCSTFLFINRCATESMTN